MKYVNAISTEGQFRLFANEIKATEHKVGFLHDNHVAEQISRIAAWTPRKFHFEIGLGDTALSGGSVGLAMLFVMDSILYDYTIKDNYVFSGEFIDNNGTLQLSGDIQDKSPYLIPDQVLVLGDGDVDFVGGYITDNTQFLRGKIKHLAEFIRNVK